MNPMKKLFVRQPKPLQLSCAAGLLAFGLAFAVQAASVPISVVVQGTVHQALFAVDFDGASGVAVGSDGEVQSTTDGGKTWTKSKLSTNLALLGVHTDATRTLAVGQTGTIFLKAAGGQWEKATSGTEKRLFSVDSNAEGLAVAVGEFGAIQLSEDGGKTWNSLTLDWMQIGTDGGAEPHLYGVEIGSDGAVSVVGEFGLVLRSPDRGRSWSVQSKATASLFSIQIQDDGKGFAVGQDGYAVKTTDNGKTWVCIDLGSKAILNGVNASADGRVVVTAMREMIVSKDGGNTWVAVDNPEVTTAWYVGVASSDTDVVAVGQAGRIIRIGS